jgi:hypothetical protein
MCGFELKSSHLKPLFLNLANFFNFKNLGV